MTTALYRRYRPQAFGEMIGQSQVTDPLMTALRSDRVGHAYLFSGPRGCGKTTSARILARCLNCAAGPTDTPCGVCDSCVELGRGGGGSLDVVEIDAASHNGVDDARDLRERAIFAPARDRFKIFILDEAHMVTQQGFNALLKLVEEPPAHVKFIFATTEPEKVLGTIRSRTHHYPFRLVPPAAMLEYVQELCETEGVAVEAGVLPLVVRAGGGSPRDTLSLLDQLIAGSDPSTGSETAQAGQVLVRYERAVALLGYTHSELLDEVVDAFAANDGAGAFASIDRVVQTGQDPRRFVDDLLERLRDLIIVAATGAGAAAVLRGVPDDELERMSRQATAFGTARLSRTADLVVAALDEMTGATSPRLQLELLVARVLTHAGVSQGTSPATAHDVEASRTSAPATGRPASPAGEIAAPAASQSPAAQSPAAPRVASPGAASPRVASPGASAPGVANPGTASSGAVAAPTRVTAPVAAPGIASPGIASPNVASPGIASPGIASPSVASSGVASPTVAAPGSAAPAVASPGAAQPPRSTPTPAPASNTSDDDAPPPFTDDDAPPPYGDDDGAPVDTGSFRSGARSGAGRPTASASSTAPAAETEEPVTSRPTAAASSPPAAASDTMSPSSAGSRPAPAEEAHPFDTAPTAADDASDVDAFPAAPTDTGSADAADAPAVDALAADAPAADAPATEAPATDAPATEAPTAEPPAQTEPATDALTADAPDASAAPEASPLEPSAPTLPATPVGPIELGHVRDAWPEVLGQLEVASRSSWLVVSTSTVAAFDDDVLTLSFRTASDLGAFKTRTPEGGPSEDLRQAIQAVLGVRVKYLARLEGDAPGAGGTGPGRPGGPSLGPASPPPPSASPSGARSSAPYASSVTEWAVAPIPTSGGAAPEARRAPIAPTTALAVDDEPADAAGSAEAVVVREGAVLPPRDVVASVPAPDEVDDDDVIPPADEVEAPLPPVVVPRMAPLGGGVQRYGEAVVRQMLSATYVRDEPYEPPTRFN
ncbi:DNA polymerase III subunit gamma and tau [Microbacterium sp. Leaf436]|uniref:DNA polymerase III subunit gamma and tau n=1 Tax=Microbacterium sp. Leaf436 TaxID=1736377 RepID=UPI0006F9EE66|nr:DNA polymerase III subunit gamma and tau [Microbacterium sp. Leaf436]KQT71949.1 DNA polymerase III subunit gamma/tau [Microbacterium sp. Leaf436]